jgi:hypothetical protein
MNALCGNCNTTPAQFACGNLCGSTFYCGKECAEAHYVLGGHKEQCPINISKIIVDLDRADFEKRGFYTASVRQMKRLYKKDIFGWFAFQIFMHSPFINSILFSVNGDWTTFNNKFNDIFQSHARVKRRINPAKPYDKFDTFFADTLDQWQTQRRKVRLDAAKGSVISTEAQLLAAYPGLRPYFKMSNARFTFEFAKHIQTAITSIPKTKQPTYVWRGYSVLNIPGTLTIDIDSLKIGQQFTTWGFMSVAIDSRISAAFLKPRNDGYPTCCMLRVLVPPNNHLFLISGESDDQNYDENTLVTHGQTEILLPAGTVVQVTSINTPQPLAAAYNKKNPMPPVYTKWADVMVVGQKPIKMK